MQAIAFHVTVLCYGQRLPGDERGTVDRHHNEYGTPYVPGNPVRHAQMQQRLSEPPYWLDIDRAKVVVESIKETCLRFQWKLWMAHARTTHFHTALTANAPPRRVREQLKARATRGLRRAGFDLERRRRWVEGGSVRHVFDETHLMNVMVYGARKQGEPMAVFVAGEGTWVSDAEL